MAHDPAPFRKSRSPGRLDENVARCRALVAASPASASAEHNLAAALGDAGRWAEAETHVRSAIAKGGGAAETWLVLGRCRQSLGAPEDAEQAFLEALRRRPDLYEAHIDLAQLRWMRTGARAAALAEIEGAIAARPKDARLTLVKAKILEGAQQIEDAFALTQEAASREPGDVALAVYAAQLAAQLGHSSAALAHAERAVGLAPQESVAAIALIVACLGAGDARRAEALALQLHQRAPDDQHAIALLATAWRLTGDPRYGALYDYDAFVRTAELDTPAGWTSRAAYVEDLRRALTASHAMRTHPFNQSIRNGSQIADILSIDDPALAALPEALDGPISRYIASLGPGDDPLRRRNAGGYAIQGIWSIRMHAGGYHIDHVHPNGWISSACYIDVPEGRTGHEGWIRFGEPGIRTTPALAAERYINPKPGMVVMFPSYMWHGVVPYAQDGARMTFAYDLEPARP